MRKSAKQRSMRMGQALCALVLAVIALCIWRDGNSELAESLRLGQPVTGMLTVRFLGQGRVIPPTLYGLVYGPRSRRLDLILIPPSAKTLESIPGLNVRTLADVYGEAYAPRGEMKRASRAMTDAAQSLLAQDPLWPDQPAFQLDIELPADSRPSFPREIKDRLLKIRSAPHYWFQLPPALVAALGKDGSGTSFYDAFLLAREFRGIDAGRIHLSKLPASNMIRPFLGRLFSPPDSAPAKTETVTVEVLNGGAAAGVALKATKVLRLHGFDVVHFGDARMKERTVRVVDRVGLPDRARAVLNALGCPDEGVLTAMEEDPHASITIILGRGYVRCSKLN